MKTRAETLEDAYKTLVPKPLVADDEFDAFYRKELNQVRGNDIVALLALGLRRSWGATPFKALLMGHAGVGKSTELARLARQVKDKFRPIRFSALDQLDPVSFKPFDVLLLMMAEIVERTARPVDQGGAGQHPPESQLKEIVDWFASEKETISTSSTVSAEMAAGAGVSGESWWAKVLGLFGNVKGEMKYASVRSEELVTYRLSRLDSLIKTANRLLAGCNQLLRESTGCEWLFIGEDFDKAGVSPRLTEDLFVSYSNVLKDLDAHLIFNIPIALGYSPKAVQLPVPQNQLRVLPDTMVFNADHTPHVAGRQAVRAVLEARINPDLFEHLQIERLIVASGGNLRDLFSLASAASDNALLRSVTHVQRSDLTSAIGSLRTDYERRLGESLYDEDLLSSDKKERMTYEKKAERLLRIYNQDETAKVPDPVLYSLLRSRAVQEFNGVRWFGVHPLVVDILNAQGKIQRQPDGTLPGGID